ncbi:cytochrome P450 [Mycena sp. CBHHK59/15]|nr:cytochrome P450 [Mycena sp. CBHHK59/15]
MTVFTETEILLASILLCWLFVLWRYHYKPLGYPLPPGPPSDPFIGHIRTFPSKNLHQVFHEWSKTYGDVMQLRTFRRSTIILGSAQAANDLLDNRSSIYSCRPTYHLLEMMECPPNVTALPYGKQFFKQRRIFHQYLSRRNNPSYEPVQRQQAQILLQDFAADPSNYATHFARYATSIVVRIAFGYHILSANDPFVEIIEAFKRKNVQGPPSALAASTVVDLLPFLKYMPSWFPGTSYVSWVKSVRPVAKQLAEYPYQTLLKNISSGRAEACIMASELEKRGQDPNHIRDIQGTGLAMYIAGASTTSFTLHVFLLAMVLHPEVQHRAQEELDAVTGPNRLPDFHDRDSLPYIDCIVRETLRWNPVAALGIPHRLLEDDIYRGMFIPKGSIIIPNIYGMTRDEAIYENPDEFNPSRFLPKQDGPGETDPALKFIYARSICPGRYLADTNLFIAMSTILSAFDITKAVDENGTEITPSVAFSSAFTR